MIKGILRFFEGEAIEAAIPHLSDLVEEQTREFVGRKQQVQHLMEGWTDKGVTALTEVLRTGIGLVPAGKFDQVLNALAKGFGEGLRKAKDRGASTVVIKAAEAQIKPRVMQLGRELLTKEQQRRWDKAVELSEFLEKSELDKKVLLDEIEKLKKDKGPMLSPEQWAAVSKGYDATKSAAKSAFGWADGKVNGLGRGFRDVGTAFGQGIGVAGTAAASLARDAAAVAHDVVVPNEQDRAVWRAAHDAGRDWLGDTNAREYGEGTAGRLNQINPNGEAIRPYRLLGGATKRHPVEILVWCAIGLVGVLIGFTVYYNSF